MLTRWAGFLIFALLLCLSSNALATQENKTSELAKEEKIEQLFNEADKAYKVGDYRIALRSYNEIVKVNPKHPTAWNEIGRIQLRLGLPAQAIQSLQLQVDINPCDDLVYRNLARAYLAMDDDEHAEKACRTQILMLPADDFCNLTLGNILLRQNRYADAIPVLETAARSMPSEPTIPVQLGIARLNTGDTDRALSDFRRALEMGKIPSIWTSVANAMSDRHLHLDEALQYARSAVDVTAPLLQAMIQQKQYKDAWILSEELILAWDAIANAQLHRGQYPEAERYASAAWKHKMFAETGERLGETYEMIGKPKSAADVYTDVLVRFAESRFSQRRLEILDSKLEAEAALKSRKLNAANDVPVLSTAAQDEAANDVWLVFDSKGKVTDLQFVEGEHHLDRFTGKTRETIFEVGFADDKSPAIVRRARIVCSRQEGRCALTLLPGGINESVSASERSLVGARR